MPSHLSLQELRRSTLYQPTDKGEMNLIWIVTGAVIDMLGPFMEEEGDH